MPANERTMLLLGLLMAQSQHGYQINEFIERNLSTVTSMKKSTAYAVLDRMAAASYVSVRTEQEGNRPLRKVYSITPTGEQHFLSLLRKSLATEDLGVLGNISFMFLDYLSRDETVALLELRLQSIDAELAQRRSVPPHGFGHAVDLALERQMTFLEAESQWIRRVMARQAGMA